MIDYELVYRKLIKDIEVLSENPDRLSVPELLGELSELVISNKNLIFYKEIEKVFEYYIRSYKRGKLAVNDYFDFSNRANFIIKFKYDADIINFLNDHIYRIDTIMEYLKNILGVEANGKN